MDCVKAIDLMGDALEGRLAPEARAGFHEHLEECGPCGTYFRQLGLVVGALGALPRGKETPRSRARIMEAFRRERGAG